MGNFRSPPGVQTDPLESQPAPAPATTNSQTAPTSTAHSNGSPQASSPDNGPDSAIGIKALLGHDDLAGTASLVSLDGIGTDSGDGAAVAQVGVGAAGSDGASSCEDDGAALPGIAAALGLAGGADTSGDANASVVSFTALGDAPANLNLNGSADDGSQGSHVGVIVDPGLAQAGSGGGGLDLPAADAAVQLAVVADVPGVANATVADFGHVGTDGVDFASGGLLSLSSLDLPSADNCSH
jgi:hypothetical protein